MKPYFFLSSFKRENKMDCKKESKRLKIIAHITPFTRKPSTKYPANIMIIALMTNKKSPKVTMVTGKVKMTKIGLTKKFNKLNTTATRIAVT